MYSVGCTVTADSCSVWSFHLPCSGNKFTIPYSGKFVLTMCMSKQVGLQHAHALQKCYVPHSVPML